MDKFAAGSRVLLQPTTITPPPAVKAMERTSPYPYPKFSKNTIGGGEIKIHVEATLLGNSINAVSSYGMLRFTHDNALI